MAKAYLKVFTEAGQEEAVKAALLGKKGVKAADLTAGGQDIICLIEAASHEDLLELVVGEFRKIEGISRTETNLVLD